MSLLRRLKSQQFGDGIRSGLMDGGTNRHLHRFQIQVAAVVLVDEDPSELLL
jgi:hypothetical protein